MQSHFVCYFISHAQDHKPRTMKVVFVRENAYKLLDFV
jgi:hypothetical protein